MKFDGSSVGKRQKSSHPHQVVFGGDVVYVPDLGMDCIHRIKIDIFKSTANLSTPTNTTTESNPNVTFSPLSPFKLPLGYGPRHLLITPPRIYLLAELVSHLIILDSLSGKLLEDVCLLDIDYDGASEIDEFQEFIFVSIRNTDGKGSKIRSESKECTDMESVQMNTNCSLSDTFNTNANDMGWIVSVNKKTFEKQINLLKGRLPRYFKIKDDLLYCLFQDQDFCQVFRIEGGLLIQVDVLTVGKGCSCLDFMVE